MGHGEHVPHDVGSDASREHLTRPRRLVLQPHSPVRRAWSGLVALALGTAFVCAPLQARSRGGSLRSCPVGLPGLFG